MKNQLKCYLVQTNRLPAIKTKPAFFAKQEILILAVIFSLAALGPMAEAAPYVSNLGDLWPNGGIGDIHALFPGGANYGTDTASFTTGAGNYSLNSITLEFEDDSASPAGTAAPQWINIQLFQKTAGGNLLLGSLANPVADSASTQWPYSSNPNAYTTFFDFLPLQQINLNPFSQYFVTLGMPANSPADAALLFTKSSVYTSAAGWAMDATISGDPYASGENLVMAVNATAVPECNTAVLMITGIVLAVGCRPFLGTNLNQKR